MSQQATTEELLRTIDLRGQQLSLAQLRRAVPRAAVEDTAQVEERVREVLEKVRDQGRSALTEYAAAFDGVEQPDPRVPAEALQQALDALDPQIRLALEESIARAQRVAQEQRPQNIPVQVSRGAEVTLRWQPMRRVGLYAPGGLAVYPSSVVMNVVPALTAGVESIALASPPQKAFNGLPHPTILAAAALLGVTEVYAIGGAQAIAAFAYGVEEVGLEPVDLITGPGNLYVATAKRLVKGLVGIDSEAGPTEIAILADDTAPASFVAADLISQAEHDPAAAAVLVTPSVELAAAVQRELEAQLGQTKHRERVAAGLSGQQSAVVLVDSLAQGIDVVNAYAAEHLEVITADAASVASQVRNAGAIFVGPSAPVSLGDYCAGSNHVLPTSGTAAFSSGLSVQTFLRGIQVIDYDRAALAQVSEHIITLARAEDLPAHGDAVSIRFREE
ncbi:histidinol dehydrogenase [Psychromicrobium sp. YIM B11713]|uniref:histidinol dehydrogenase n=1 Tax=Psychromicrobium sp. YIM B11713 TaxID=3145233 RepID=UPI00374FADD4